MNAVRGKLLEALAAPRSTWANGPIDGERSDRLSHAFCERGEVAHHQEQ